MRRHNTIISSSTGALPNYLYKLPVVGPQQNKENIGLARNSSRERELRHHDSKENSKRKPIFNQK